MLLGVDRIATILRNAREKKSLSQRDLSAVSGVPQSHISKIEKGAVDLRLSSLVELARTLDLEVTLVPRSAVPAVQSIVRSTAQASDGKQTRLALKDLHRLEQTITRNSSVLPLTPKELAEVQQQLRLLSHFPLSEPDRKTIQSAYKTLQTHLSDHKNLNALRQAFAHLKDLRNRVAHRPSTVSGPQPVRPAYTLDEDDDDA
ncbi:MAG: helix-turn-helix domain-containing protein [Rhodospirillales bacterium]|nr:helix-turn-helix domain-containing protein [Rhodospirillales bacterium]